MNKFYNALNARLNTERAKSENRLSDVNLTKLQTARDRMKAPDILAFLNDNAVTTDFANDAVYEIEKIAVVLMNARKLDVKFNVMIKHILLTAINCAHYGTTMTLRDAKDACSSDRVVADDRLHLVNQRREVTSDGTVNAQHQQSVAALRALNILSASSASAREAHYSVNAANTIFQALKTQLEA